MRVGIIGTGGMARTMVKAIGAAPGMTVTAVASRSRDRAESFARGQQVEHWFGDISSLAACSEVDLVYVASHPDRHVGDCRLTLEAGKPVLCEKPLATSAADAELLAEVAAKHGTFLMEGLWLRFLPAVRHAEQLVRERACGTPLLLQANFGYPVAAGTASPGTDVGVLLDRAVYPISLAIFLLGPALESSALVARDSNGIATQAAFVLRHDGGTLSELSVSSEAHLSNTAAISCERGRIELAEPLLGTERVIVREHAPLAAASASDEAPSTKQKVIETLKSSPLLRRLRASASRGGTSQFFSYGPSPYVPQLQEVARCVERGETQCSTMPLAQTIETLRIIEQAESK
ncbi:MAG: Gfo/Idh/MocA family protein [Polyangiales bacterium]